MTAPVRGCFWRAGYSGVEKRTPSASATWRRSSTRDPGSGSQSSSGLNSRQVGWTGEEIGGHFVTLEFARGPHSGQVRRASAGTSGDKEDPHPFGGRLRCEAHRRGILSRRVTDRAAELPAASELVIRIRVASVPCLAKPAALRARRIETVDRCPGPRLTCFEPSTTAAGTLPRRIFFAVASRSVVRHPPASPAGQETGTRATSRRWRRATLMFPSVGSCAAVSTGGGGLVITPPPPPDSPTPPPGSSTPPIGSASTATPQGMVAPPMKLWFTPLPSRLR